MDGFSASRAGWSENLQIYDTTETPLTGDPLLPFAFDELACRAIARGEQGPILHLWRHRRAFVLGLRDRKLPRAAEAIAALEEAGWRTAVRHSGGAAVPLDAGVINVSLLLPQPRGTVRLHDDFAIMETLIRKTVEHLAPGVRVSAGEVEGAFCPGDFDLAVAGRKFCGIAQRRISGAFMLQAFVVVEGSGAQRARHAAAFYRRAAGPAGIAQVPGALNVSEESTRSLRELIGEGGRIDRFVQMLKRVAAGGRPADAAGAMAAPRPAGAGKTASSVAAVYGDEALIAEAMRIRARYDGG